MYLLKIIHFLSRYAERTFRLITPDSRIMKWFSLFRCDAEVLCLVADELRRARTFTLLEDKVDGKILTEFSVYHAAYFFGNRQYHGMKKRWPRSLLSFFTNTGLQLDATQWQTGCDIGFNKTL